MKKAYFVGLCLLSIVSCSAPGDELETLNESQTLNGSSANQLAKGGFRDNPDTPTPPPAGIWSKSFYLTNPIYGFYSDLTKKHLYNTSPLPSELPKSYPGLSYYFQERLLGSADGPGPVISRWFHTGSNDLVLTTNPNELSGQSYWEKKIWEQVIMVMNREVFRFTGILILIKRPTSTPEIRMNWEMEKTAILMKELLST
ncbi:hypothetical protein [Chryseobacterium sp. MEBOG07]|uniref:hypothetical protein n=1 Tax=Chryseobacterium sp. MEBOG07 TaxID=2879939 RepID=UPI001F422894|nr:hypothetical protein [Chryseobacterium sp. MEBOG07]UKB78381.1 hypothetical protein LF886_18140 [Chryseobacterium sp. MEBOG07]